MPTAPRLKTYRFQVAGEGKETLIQAKNYESAVSQLRMKIYYAYGDKPPHLSYGGMVKEKK